MSNQKNTPAQNRGGGATLVLKAHASNCRRISALLLIATLVASAFISVPTPANALPAYTLTYSEGAMIFGSANVNDNAYTETENTNYTINLTSPVGAPTERYFTTSSDVATGNWQINNTQMTNGQASVSQITANRTYKVSIPIAATGTAILAVGDYTITFNVSNNVTVTSTLKQGETFELDGIEWRVLIPGNESLIIAEHVIETKQFHNRSPHLYPTWTLSDIRTYLKDTFLPARTTLSSKAIEKNNIMTMSACYKGCSGSYQASTDKIFLPSIEEVYYTGQVDNTAVKDSATVSTVDNRANGSTIIFADEHARKATGVDSSWWLRSPSYGGYYDVASLVTGTFDTLNFATVYGPNGFRPALYLNLESSFLKTYNLTVTGGSGSGWYAENAEIPIAANPPQNQTFDHWTKEGDGSFDSDTTSPTTFTMPASATTVTAHYRYSTPIAPTINGTPTATAITLNTIPNAQYAIKTINSIDQEPDWKDSPTFTNLIPNTAYTFIAQIKANGSVLASLPSPASETITTLKHNQSVLQITGLNPTYTYGQEPFNISTEGGTGEGAVTYSSSNEQIATVNDNQITIHKAGSFQITATKATDDTYNETQTTSETITVNKKTLTIDNVAVNSKPYDKSNIAQFTETPELAGKESGDTVNLILGTPTFSSINANNDIDIEFTDFSIEGADAENYLLIQPSGIKANITPKPVTLQGVVAESKVYDGNTTATISGTRTIDGNLDNTNLTIDTTNATATFDNANAGNDKTVTFDGFSLAGDAKENYTLSEQPQSVKANITKAPQPETVTPTLASKTSTSVTLATIQGAEYSKDNTTWQSSPVFTNLTPNTAYTFYARLSETDTHLASEAETIQITTDKTPPPTTPTPKPSATPTPKPTVTPTPTKPIVKLPPKVKTEVAKHHFTDISNLNNSRQTAIEWMYQYGITLGSPANSDTYKPKDTVTRGQMAEFLYKLRNKPKTTKQVPKLTDISKLNKERKTAIKWLASEKITVPTNNKFNPKNAVNRGAMAEFLYKIAGSPAFTPTKQDYAKIKDISLVGNNQGRRKAIAWLVKNNITVLNKGKFNPQNAVNRGSMAEFVMKLYRVYVK